MKKLLCGLTVLSVTASLVAANVPIKGGILQSDLNAAGFSITNGGSFVGTHVGNGSGLSNVQAFSFSTSGTNWIVALVQSATNNATFQGNTFNGASQLLQLDPSGLLPTATFPNVNGNVGTFGDSSHSVTVTVDAKGRATAISQSAISGGGSAFPLTSDANFATFGGTNVSRFKGTNGTDTTFAGTGLVYSNNNGFVTFDSGGIRTTNTATGASWSTPTNQPTDGFVSMAVGTDGTTKWSTPPGGPPSGSAGGVLSGSYPNPGFGSFSSATLGSALTDKNGTGADLFTTGDAGQLINLSLTSISNVPPRTVIGNNGTSSGAATAIPIAGLGVPQGTNQGDLIVFNTASNLFLSYPLGQYFGTGATTNGTATNLVSLVLLTNQSARIKGDFVAGGATNSGSWSLSGLFRNDGGVITAVQTNMDNTLTNAKSAGWKVLYLPSGSTNLLVQAVGDSVEAVNWQWQGLFEKITNAAQPVVSGGTAGTIVQSKWSSTGSSSASVTLTAVGSGHLVVVLVACTQGPTSLAAANVSDGVASYALDLSSALTTGTLVGSFSRVTGASGSLTITATPNTGGSAAAVNICAYEISGLTANAFDNGASGTASSTSATSGTFNTSSAGVMMGMEADLSGANITHTATGSFAISDSGNAHRDDNTGANMAGAAEHKSTGSSGTGVSATMTLGTSESWLMLGVGYK